MNAGDRIIAAHKSAAAAIGRLSLLIAKERVSRSTVEQALRELSEATNQLQLVLAPPTAPPAPRGVPRYRPKGL